MIIAGIINFIFASEFCAIKKPKIRKKRNDSYYSVVVDFSTFFVSEKFCINLIKT